MLQGENTAVVGPPYECPARHTVMVRRGRVSFHIRFRSGSATGGGEGRGCNWFLHLNDQSRDLLTGEAEPHLLIFSKQIMGTKR